MTDEPRHHATSIQAIDDAFSDLVTIKLDSCHSTWYFQPVRMRFRRGPKAVGATSGWRPYYGVRFDDALDGFVVLLNPEGTRLLRSRCHDPGSSECESCGEEGTAEVLVEDIRKFLEEG